MTVAARTKRWRFLWPLVLLAAGAGVAAALLLTAPQTEPEAKRSAARLVQVIDARPHTASISVSAYGAVIPAREIDIQLEIGGRVAQLHEALVPGGRLAAGEQILAIDRVDYEIALAERRAELEEAEFELAVERGRQVVAVREWGLLEKDLDDSEVNRSLVLREPHLARAMAAVSKANNAIEKAELDLARTSVTTPFNAVVIRESVEVGQLIEPGNSIATLADTDVFRVQVTVPMEELRWIRFPGGDGASPGARASITLDTGDFRQVSWSGRVERFLGDLETSGRMARVVVAVDDPLAGSGDANGLPLLLGSYVRVDIDAGELDNVLAVPRSALRDGDRLWSVDADNKLRIHDSSLRWIDGDTLLVENTIPAGEKLVVSILRAPLPGMDVNPQPVTHAVDPAP